MKFSEVIGRLNGFSTPIFGVSWTPPTSDVAVARQVLTYLEDRRVLYNPYDVESPEHVVASILEIRRYLTEILGQGGIDNTLAAPLRIIRAAARKFMDQHTRQEADASRIYIVSPPFGGSQMSDPGFNQALGEFRALVGIQLAHIAAAFGLDVEEPLSNILPGPDRDTDTPPTATRPTIIADEGRTLYLEPPNDS